MEPNTEDDSNVIGQGRFKLICQWDGMGNEECACHQVFMSNTTTAKYCKRMHYARCRNCGKKYQVSNPKRPGGFCSRSCQQAYRQKEEHGGSNSYKKCALPGCNKPRSARNAETCCYDHAVKLRQLRREAGDYNNKTEKVCEWPYCDNTFIPERSSQKYCNSDDHYAICQAKVNGRICGKKFRVDPRKVHKGHFPVSCCTSHAAIISHSPEAEQKRIANSYAKWGTKTPLQAPSVKAKIKKTLDENPDKDYRIGSENSKALIKDKYGVDNVSQLESVKEKKIETSLLNWGTDNPMSSKTVKDKLKESNVERYGVPTPLMLPENKQKAIDANRRIFGKDYPMQSEDYLDNVLLKPVEDKYGDKYYLRTEEGKEHYREVSKSKYGVSWPLSSPEVRSKMVETIRKKYHDDTIDNVFQVREVQDKAKSTLKEKYGLEYDNVSQIPEVKEKISASLEKSANEGRMSGNRISRINRWWAAEIQRLFPGTNVTFEKPIGNGMNADLSLTSSDGRRNLVIDINPTISHNSYLSYKCIIDGCGTEHERKGHQCTDPVSSVYAFNRAKSAMDTLPDSNYVQIWDWEWNDVPNHYAITGLVPLIAAHMAPVNRKLSARKCFVTKLKQNEANRFLATTHPQGAAKGQSKCYGLVMGDELLAVATFGHPRFRSDSGWEWIRYAVKPGVIIHGGQGRLFDRFLEDNRPRSVISYLDFNKTTVEHTWMDTIGFSQSSFSGPSLTWSKGSDRVQETSLLKVGADDLLASLTTGYKPYGSIEECGLDNHGIMLEEGWLPVYTAGNRLYRWHD